jgi:hypothetical protein
MTEQERLSVLNEVEQIIQDELRKIIGDRKIIDNPADGPMICGINRVGAALNGLRFSIRREST